MAAQLVLSQLVGNKMKNNGSAIILTAPGAAGGGISSIAVRHCLFILTVCHDGVSSGYWWILLHGEADLQSDWRAAAWRDGTPDYVTTCRLPTTSLSRIL